MLNFVDRLTPLPKLSKIFGGLFIAFVCFPSFLHAQCPVLTNITRSDARCGEINGFISFDFENNLSQTHIEFSLDGGVSYPLQVPTADQFAIFESLSSGTYEIFTRWADGSCVTDLGVVVLGDQPPPVVAVTTEDYICGADTGRIDFAFGLVSGRESIEFSLDSGITYPFFVSTDRGGLSIDSLAPGTYDLFARWGNQDCPTSLGSVTLSAVNGNPPEVTVQDFNNDCINGDDDLALTMYFDEEPSQSSISFSLDGGENYPYNVPDDSDSLRIDPIDPGTYQLFTRWGDENCEEEIGYYAVGVPPSITVKANNASCGFTKGSITFFYPEYVNKNQIQFSVDSGLTYTHSGPAINGNTTYINLEVGTYHVFARWSDGTCPIDLGEYTIVISNGGQPNVSVATSEAACGPGSGMIAFSFPTHPSRPDIQFSIDGGNTFPYTRDVDDSPLLLHNINPGTYGLVARWGNGDCPINLGTFTLSDNSRDLPEAIVVNRAENCRTFGRNITFAFQDNPTESTLEFSNDGGLTYPLRVNDDTETATFINLDPGTYHLFVRWGDGLCPVDLGEWTVGNDESFTLPPEATYQSSNPTCINNDGSVTVYMEDSPDQDSLEVFLAGDLVNYIKAGDDQDSVVFSGLSEGDYTLSIQWADSSCPINLGLIQLTTEEDAGSPVVSTSFEAPTCWGRPGSISFSFEDDPDHDTLEVSFNGGLSYPLIFADDQGSVTFSGFESGTYDLFARWRGGSCQIALGEVVLSDSASYPAISYTKLLPSCESPFGGVRFEFSPSSDQTEIQFSLDNGVTYFSPVSDTVGEVTYSNLDYQAYQLWGRWGDGSCAVSIGTVDFSQDRPEPIASFLVSPPSCEASDGSIQFQFDAHSLYTQIEFSLDGGDTYPLVVNDDLGVASFSDLAPGKYDLYARWGGQSCSGFLGQADLTQIAGAAEVDITLQYPTCGNNDGRILFGFENNPDQSFIEFSLDGGNTYPLIVNDLLGAAAFTNVGEGIYDVYARWGDGSCPSSLGLVDMTLVEGVPEVVVSQTNPTCGNSDGSIRLSFTDNPDHSIIEFSIDGGATYPLSVNDALGLTAFTNVAPGEYLLYARWGDDSCPTSLGVVDLTRIEGAPEVEISTQPPSCGQDNGRINFSFASNPDQSLIQFSLDGGATYPLTVNSSAGVTSFTNVAPGAYILYSRWGDGTCETSLGTLDLSSPDQAPGVVYTVSSPSCESNSADIQFTFEDNPLQDSIQISLDGGLTFPFVFSLANLTPTLENIPLEDYSLYARWGDGQCPTYLGELDLRDVNEIPRAFFTISSPSCDGNDGIITFEFDNNPSRSTIEFSLDGGDTYPLSVPDNSGSASFTGLDPGFYQLAARWGGAECPIILGFADLTTVSGGPDVSVTSSRPVCGQRNGSISLTFENAPGRDKIEFSLDGGQSYPYSAFTSEGSLVIENLSPGLYDVFAQWGGSGQKCPVRVQVVDLTPSGEIPMVNFEAQASSSCSDPSGSVLLTFEDHPSLSLIEFSVDGGRSYRYEATDDSDSLRIEGLDPGTYEIYVRWDGEFCPVFLGSAVIELETGFPDLSYSIAKPSCDGEDGLISFSIGEVNASLGDSISFSLDGGRTYPYSVSSTNESFTIPSIGGGYYELFAQFTSGIPCPIRLGIADLSPLTGAPRVFFTQSSPSCQNALGSLSFYFEDMVGQDSLQFSLDGGASYPIRVSDLEGSLDLPNLMPDVYEIFVRVGDESCPLFMGTADLTQTIGAPQPTISVTEAICGGNEASISFYHTIRGRRGDIEISLDGGATYPYLWAMAEQEFVLSNLPPNEYNVFARWTTGEVCETPLEVVDLKLPIGAPITTFSISAPTSCESVDGSITFTFEDEQDQEFVSFSMDGGHTYALTVPDSQETATIDGLKSDRYDIYVKWGEDNCTLLLGRADLINTGGEPDVQLAFEVPDCGETGSISFTFPDDSNHESLEFSLDGGFSFPLRVSDTVGVASFSDLGPGYYEPVVRWADTRTCTKVLSPVSLIPTEGSPMSTFTVTPPSDCHREDGTITFSFPDFEERTSLQFSIDGGNSFPIFVNDTSETVTIYSVPPGLHPLYARWGNGECPLFLGIADIHSSLSHPEVSYSFQPATCGNTDGAIELTIEEDARYEYVEFSLDGGRTFTHRVKTSEGYLSLSGFEPGVYDLYTRWADTGACPVPIGTVDLRDQEGPIVNYFAVSSPSSCEEADGEIRLFFEENALRSNIKFSIDGGETYPYIGRTELESFTISELPNGFYDVVAIWGDDSCPTYVGTADVSSSQEAPDVFVSVEPSDCIGGIGALTFHFNDLPSQDSLAFSLDGGETYPLVVSDAAEWATWEEIPATTYDLWVRWGDSSCIMNLGEINLNNESLPASDSGFIDLTYKGPSCGATDGWIAFTPDSIAALDSFQVSLDGGNSWVVLPDSLERYRVDSLSVGTYIPWVIIPGTLCTIELDTLMLTEEYPRIELTALHSDCGDTTGTLFLDFQDSRFPEDLLISLDGGLTFPYQGTDSTTSLTLSDMPLGVYDIYAKWGSRGCDTLIGSYVLKDSCDDATIFGTVWQDEDKDGIFDEGESGLADVSIALLNESLFLVSSTTTDENGEYRFSSLDSAVYFLSIAIPEDYELSPFQGASELRGNDFNPLTNRTSGILIPGTSQSFDAGLMLNAGNIDCNKNLALDKVAIQSSTLLQGEASLANDGDASADKGAIGPEANIAHTLEEENPWWQVDLGEISSVFRLKVLNRTDCCSDHLADFHVFFSEDPISDEISLDSLMADTSLAHIQYEGVVDSVAEIPVRKVGRYLRIQLEGSTFLSMAEVEAIGCVGIQDFGTENPVDTTDGFILKTYPVPASEFLVIEILNSPDSVEVYELELVDYRGRPIYLKVVEPGIHTISVEGFAKGLYVLKVRSEVASKTERLIFK